jgi:hypothetical protein
MDRRRNRKKFTDDFLVTMRCLPLSAQHEAMLTIFGAGLRQLSLSTIRKLRAQLILKAPTCPCGCNNRLELAEILEGHVALRDHGLVRTRRRRAAKRIRRTT